MWESSARSWRGGERRTFGAGTTGSVKPSSANFASVATVRQCRVAARARRLCISSAVVKVTCQILEINFGTVNTVIDRLACSGESQLGSPVTRVFPSSCMCGELPPRDGANTAAAVGASRSASLDNWNLESGIPVRGGRSMAVCRPRRGGQPARLVRGPPARRGQPLSHPARRG